ncbi:UNVERIFIED_CONTAM: hypothetical protein K2H54_044640 [Gekko kuhli]
MTPQVDFAVTGLHRAWGFQFFHGTISFTIHSHELHGFQNFVRELKPYEEQGNAFLKDFWEQAFDCFYPDPQEPGDISETCTGEERLDSLSSSLFEMSMTGHSYSIYNSVYAIAHAIHDLYSSRSNHRAMKNGKMAGFEELRPWQVMLTQRDVPFVMTKVKIGKVNPNAPEGQELIIHEDMIVWQTIFHKEDEGTFYGGWSG